MRTLPFSSLVDYLTHSGWMANVQFILFVVIFGMLADRAWRSLGWFGNSLPPNERITSKVIDQITSACMSMGLLLTFSGLYQYIGVPSDQQDRWPLLLALGSSAIGYGAMMLFQLVGTLDEWRDAASARVEPEPLRAPPPTPSPRVIAEPPLPTNGRDSPPPGPKRPSVTRDASPLVPHFQETPYPDLRSKNHESQSDVDDGSRSRHLGSLVPGTAHAPSAGLGSLGNHAVEESTGPRV